MGVERLGDVALILSALDLHDIENTVWEPYHREGAGRPPRNPVGIFKALVVKRLRQIPSDRELYRRLWDDPLLREICDIEDRERPYHPSQLTRFRRRVGPERRARAPTASGIPMISAGDTRIRKQGWGGTTGDTTSATGPTSRATLIWISRSPS